MAREHNIREDDEIRLSMEEIGLHLHCCFL